MPVEFIAELITEPLKKLDCYSNFYAIDEAHCRKNSLPYVICLSYEPPYERELFVMGFLS